MYQFNEFNLVIRTGSTAVYSSSPTAKPQPGSIGSCVIEHFVIALGRIETSPNPREDAKEAGHKSELHTDATPWMGKVMEGSNSWTRFHAHCEPRCRIMLQAAKQKLLKAPPSENS